MPFAAFSLTFFTTSAVQVYNNSLNMKGHAKLVCMFFQVSTKFDNKKNERSLFFMLLDF